MSVRSTPEAQGPWDSRCCSGPGDAARAQRCLSSISVTPLRTRLEWARTFQPTTRTPQLSQERTLLVGVQVTSYMPVFTHRFAERRISVLQIRGLTALEKRTRHTHMACEEFFQIALETLCADDLPPFPDEWIPASSLVQCMIPSALSGAMRSHPPPNRRKRGGKGRAGREGRAHNTHPIRER